MIEPIEAIFTDVEEELNFAMSKFPQWPTDMLQAFAVVQEEIGETQKDILQYTYEPNKGKTLEMIRKEAIQSISMLVRFIHSLDCGSYSPVTEQHLQIFD